MRLYGRGISKSALIQLETGVQRSELFIIWRLKFLLAVLCKKLIHRMRIQSTICGLKSKILYINLKISYLRDYTCRAGWILSI